MVQPSLDWPGEPLRSLVWTLQAWAVTMLVFLAVAVIVARFTQWGQQFWRVNAPFWSRPKVGVKAPVGSQLRG
ncbi:hypothetical protein [Mycobacteroides abscessus]|uniref:hypothetical protein n=1 Tax=Mycobacteroides abscessus TaxID=36809 RepID=UPI0009A81BFD|nr:hypothetical protein [Mycobacteroides abscessus]SKT92215.1 ABC transporter ATP-binding protein [Mycobacteroides abscessus subsp. massiliense]SKU11142.1 ABC transporter ATP-binding protein [Mycobacteroides abscessus subsp. massiliense]